MTGWFALTAVILFYLSGMWVTSYIIGRFTNWRGENAGPFVGVIFWPALPLVFVIFGPFLLVIKLMVGSFQKGRTRRYGGVRKR